LKEHESVERENTPVNNSLDPTHSTDPPHASHPPPALTPSPIYSCYHDGCDFHTSSERDYQSHGALKHPKNPLLYPTMAEIKQYGLKPQDKEWEK
jgi:hypothetical protein